MSWRRLAKTVLALRGSGGIKAGKGSPPARALGSHAFFALPAALRILRKKSCCGCSPVVPPPPAALQPQQLFFLKMRRAAATEVEIAFFFKMRRAAATKVTIAFFVKKPSKINTVWGLALG